MAALNMWSKYHSNCISCKSTLFNHKGKGHCEKCYSVERKKSKLKNELINLSLDEIINNKRPLLPHHYWKTNTKELLIKAIIDQEDSKLHYLKYYGDLESGQINIDLLNFERIFNELADRTKNKNTLYTHKLNSLFTSINNDQRKEIIMQLLKILIKYKN